MGALQQNAKSDYVAHCAGACRAKMRLSFGGAASPHATGSEAPAAHVAQQGSGAAERAVGEDQGESAPDLEPAQRPLVVVVDNTEAADLLALRDLILVLSEVCCLSTHTWSTPTPGTEHCWRCAASSLCLGEVPE